MTRKKCPCGCDYPDHWGKKREKFVEVAIRVSPRFPKRTDKMQEFMQRMSNRLAFGATRHERSVDKFGNPAQDYLKRLKRVISDFERTGNLELLIDAANYCALEFYNSLHPAQHYAPRDSQGQKNLHGERF